MLDAGLVPGATPALSRPRQPLLWAALAFAAGTVFGAYLWRPPVWWAVAACFFAAFTTYFVRHRPRVAPAIAILLTFSAGALMIEVRPPVDPGWEILQFADGREVTVTAHVTKEGLLRDAGFGGLRQIIEADTEEISSDDGTFPVRAGVRFSLYAKPASNQTTVDLYEYGQRLRFSAR